MNQLDLNLARRIFTTVSEVTRRGGSINSALENLSRNSGTSLSSLRSHYYSLLKLFKLMPEVAESLGVELTSVVKPPFELFTGEEINMVIRTVLIEKAKGRSVRAILYDLAGGDYKTYIRYQNKYRTLVAKRRSEVTDVLTLLAQSNIPHYNPYERRVARGGTSLDQTVLLQ